MNKRDALKKRKRKEKGTLPSISTTTWMTEEGTMNK
jgi:hypothetical protein